MFSDPSPEMGFLSFNSRSVIQGWPLLELLLGGPLLTPKIIQKTEKRLQTNYCGTNPAFSSFSPRTQVLPAARRAVPRPNSREDAQNQIFMPMERRITESWNSLGHLPPDQVAQSPTQPDLEYFQGWGTYNLKPNSLHFPARGKPIPGFGTGLAGPGHPRSSS